MRAFVIAFLILFSNASIADWHVGKINYIGVGYDGATITLILDGWSRNNCTCYAWTSHMCLDNSRATSDFEKSLILAARAKQVPIQVFINETTCKIEAMVESD